MSPAGTPGEYRQPPSPAWAPAMKLNAFWGGLDSFFSTGSLAAPYASITARLAIAWPYMLWGPAKLPSFFCLDSRYLSPDSTVFWYLPSLFLWVSPAARKGRRAIPVA